ncbi:MAG TPA: 30S ribosomal protein S8 [Candidatus Paceibacterota bacterium]|nr:30S ribosomal protein S8 [Candidatus Paceibacterota bacterium]
MNDPIADMITRIRNGQMVKKETIKVPFSKFKMDILNVLKKNGYIKDFTKVGREPKRMIEITLMYNEDKTPKITEIRKVSKPSQRVYRKSKQIWPAKGGFGIYIISTPQGVMTNKEAKKKNLGGEILLEVW